MGAIRQLCGILKIGFITAHQKAGRMVRLRDIDIALDDKISQWVYSANFNIASILNYLIAIQ
jgi:hypothetical protein